MKYWTTSFLTMPIPCQIEIGRRIISVSDLSFLPTVTQFGKYTKRTRIDADDRAFAVEAGDLEKINQLTMADQSMLPYPNRQKRSRISDQRSNLGIESIQEDSETSDPETSEKRVEDYVEHRDLHCNY